jgi:hypothetical protein
LRKERLQAFGEAVDAIMQEKQDFVIIFEGRVQENRAKILEFLDDEIKWNYRELTCIANKAAFDRILQQGAFKKRRRVRRGFAASTYKKTAFVCWKGKVPKVTNRRRPVVDVGSYVADDVMSNVPLLDMELRPVVPASVKEAVLKGSTWAGQAPEPPKGKKDENNSDSDAGGRISQQ